MKSTIVNGYGRTINIIPQSGMSKALFEKRKPPRVAFPSGVRNENGGWNYNNKGRPCINDHVINTVPQSSMSRVFLKNKFYLEKGGNHWSQSQRKTERLRFLICLYKSPWQTEDSQYSQRFQQPFVDVVKSAIGHNQYKVAVSCFLD